MRRSVAGGVMEVRPWVTGLSFLSYLFVGLIIWTFVRGVWMVSVGETKAAAWQALSVFLYFPVLIYKALYLKDLEDPVLLADYRRQCLVLESGDKVSGFRTKIWLKDIHRVEVRALMPWVWHQTVVFSKSEYKTVVPALSGFGRRRLNRMVEEVRRFMVEGG